MKPITYNWHKENVRRQTGQQRGTNISLRPGLGTRQLDQRTTAGGPTGTAIAPGSVNGDQLGNIMISTPHNLQSSMLPNVSDATVWIQTFGGGNTTVDAQVYGAGGSSSASGMVTVTRPDSSQIVLPYYHQGHNFGSSGVTVYAMFYYDIWALTWRVLWQNTQFSAAQFSLAQGDSMIPFVANPNDSNVGMITGTGGTYTKTLTGPGFFR